MTHQQSNDGPKAIERRRQAIDAALASLRNSGVPSPGTKWLANAERWVAGELAADVWHEQLFTEACAITDPVAARCAAMADQAARYAELRGLHAAIVEQFIGPSTDAENAMLAQAERQIDTWERGHTCSPIYIRVWRRILRDPAARLDRYIVRDHYGNAKALMQNSPFGFLLVSYRNGELG